MANEFPERATTSPTKAPTATTPTITASTNAPTKAPTTIAPTELPTRAPPRTGTPTRKHLVLPTGPPNALPTNTPTAAPTATPPKSPVVNATKALTRASSLPATPNLAERDLSIFYCQSMVTGNYFSAGWMTTSGWASLKLEASLSASGEWTLVPSGNDWFYLVSILYKGYLSASADVRKSPIITFKSPTDSEKWKVTENADKTKTFLSFHGTYLTASRTGDIVMATQIGSSARWNTQRQFVTTKVSDISDSERKALMNWIKAEVALEKTPFCWKKTYGRGVGLPLKECPHGREKIGLLCYSSCPAGFVRKGFDCHSICPDGFRDDGLYCRLPEYGRGSGYPWIWEDICIFCDVYAGRRSRCERDHGKGMCELWGEVYYPKCKENFRNVLCCVCQPNPFQCSQFQLNDAGVWPSCGKKIIIGDPSPMTCSSGLQQDGGLCYPYCGDGFYGVGPVCYERCAGVYQDCGLGCSKNCASDIVNQVFATVMLAINLATMGIASAGTASASTGFKLALSNGKSLVANGKTSTLMLKAISAYTNDVTKVNALMDKAVVVTKVLSFGTTQYERYQASDLVMETMTMFLESFTNDFEKLTSKDINAEINRRFKQETATYIKEQWGNVQMRELTKETGMSVAKVALGTVSTFDPTGVLGVIDAYTQPICNSVVPFPCIRTDTTRKGVPC